MAKLPNPATEWASGHLLGSLNLIGRVQRKIKAPQTRLSRGALLRTAPPPRSCLFGSVNSALGSGLNVGDANHAGRFVYGSGHIYLLAFKLLRLCLVIKLIGHSVRF